MAGRALVVTLAAAVALAGAGCGGGGADSGDAESAPTEVVGVITEISRAGDRIDAITIRSDEESHRVELDPAIDYGFDVEHLEEHRTTGDPVRCSVTQRGDALVATAILDA